MDKPKRFAVFCNSTGKLLYETDSEPQPYELKAWLDTDDLMVKTYKQVRTVYEDIRYKAKLRLYNYVTYTKQGLPTPQFKPFDGTEIGKSIPILNF